MANKVTSKKLIERKDQCVYLDVREADELGEGMIDGIVNVPLGLFVECLEWCF